MSVRPFDPTELDFAILREMYPARAVALTGIDPRLNATRVSRSLHIGRARVAARLRWWKESGFLEKYSVWPNPALIGWHGAWVPVRVDHHRSKRGLFERFGLVDGVVSAMDFLGDWVSVAVVAPDPAAMTRRVGLLRNLVGVTEVEPYVPWRLAEPKRPLTPLELRIVTALRARPTATLNEIAKDVRISARTMTRKYAELLDEWAVWFVPVFNFAAFTRPVVSLNLRLVEGTGRDAIGQRIRTQYPLVMDFAAAGPGPDMPPQDAIFFVAAPSSASLEHLEQFVSSLPGVEGLESYTMVRTYDYPDWFDRHLATLSTETRGPIRRTGRARRHDA